jgi:hypothetical protein
MTSLELKNLLRTGLLKSEPGEQTEFDHLVQSGRRRLRDAHNATLSLESRFDLAYNAAHALSLAALRWHGYRSEKRYAVFQALPHTLGVEAVVWRVLDKCHQRRNLAEYEGHTDIDVQLLTDLLGAAEEVLAAVATLGPVPPRGRGS